MTELETAEVEISKAWRRVKKVEKYGIAFGKTYRSWAEKLSPQAMADLCKRQDIDINIAGWWGDLWAKSEGMKALHNERHVNRNDPPDSFEPIRKLAIKMLNIGYQQLWSTGDGDRSQLVAAKQWAYGKLKEPA
jgi:hypothetical protein